MSSAGANDDGSILLMTGMNLSLLLGPGPTHRMAFLIRYLDEREVPYTAVFPLPGGSARQWKSGAGTFIGIPSAVLGEFLPGGSRRQLQLNVLRLMRFALRVLRMRQKHWRICIVHGDLMAVMAAALRQMGKIDFLVYEDLDFLPAFEWSPHTFNRAQIAFTETWAIRNSDLVVSVSDELATLRLRQGAKKAITVPNGVDLSAFAGKDSEGRRKPYLLYSGTLATWSGVHVTINALPGILKRAPEVRFRVIGRGFCDSELRALARERGVEAAVDFLGPKRHDELPALYGECSVGMAVFPANELMRYSFPLKVSEYLAAGLPVVSTGADGTRQVLKDSGAGLFVENNVEAIAEACAGLITDHGKWAEMSGRAKEAAGKLDWRLLFDGEMKRIRDFAGGGE
jgi:glycosyltransferase involved in cell wall biosynthesis